MRLFLQDNYLEEALKMRNLLQEFLRPQRRSPPTIIGMREHVFTGRLGPKKFDVKVVSSCSCL